MCIEKLVFYSSQFVDGFNVLDVGKLTKKRSICPAVLITVCNEQTYPVVNIMFEEIPHISVSEIIFTF